MKYVRSEEIITADMAGEVVMLDAEKGKYYSLGDSGSDIWKILKEPKTVEEIVTELLDIYEVDAEQCKTETVSYLKTLVKMGLVREQK